MTNIKKRLAKDEKAIANYMTIIVAVIIIVAGIVIYSGAYSDWQSENDGDDDPWFDTEDSSDDGGDSDVNDTPDDGDTNDITTSELYSEVGLGYELTQNDLVQYKIADANLKGGSDKLFYQEVGDFAYEEIGHVKITIYINGIEAAVTQAWFSVEVDHSTDSVATYDPNPVTVDIGPVRYESGDSYKYVAELYVDGIIRDELVHRGTVE